jgi:putative endonuclease
MNYFTYALYSKTFHKIYVGQTMDLEKRLEEHNSGLSNYTVGESGNIEQRLEFHNITGTGFTACYRPWKVVFKYECVSRKTALELEKKIKNWKKLLAGGESNS